MGVSSIFFSDTVHQRAVREATSHAMMIAAATGKSRSTNLSVPNLIGLEWTVNQSVVLLVYVVTQTEGLSLWACLSMESLGERRRGGPTVLAIGSCVAYNITAQWANTNLALGVQCKDRFQNGRSVF